MDERGVLIIATGKTRYLNLAKNCAVSLRLTNPEIKIALVTDIDIKPGLLFNYVVPARIEYGSGFSQKVHMNKYSPFKKTLFIDADCLVLRNIDFIWNNFDGKAVSVLGSLKNSGPYIGTTIEALRSEFDFISLPSFNGGVYYFEKGTVSDQIFEFARDIFLNKYDKLNLIKFNGKPGDEPAMAIAMGVYGVVPFDDKGFGMYTPVGQSGNYYISVSKGECSFNKYDKIVYPSIMHFGGGYPEAFHYRREVKKLKMIYYYKFNPTLATVLVNSVWNTFYALEVFLYRVMKWMTGRAKMKFKPILPMFRFE